MGISSNNSNHLKKSWIIGAMIARELLLCKEGDKLPAIQEYANNFSSSRGVVQNALAQLQEDKTIILSKRGKLGTVLQKTNNEKLLKAADLQYMTGSMAPPIDENSASLATGISLSFKEGSPYFNFAFMHSSENRAKALNRMACDFIVVSKYSAKFLMEKYPDITIAITLDGSIYQSPLCLWSKNKDAKEIQNGNSIAVDPNSNDQYEATMKICEGKDVHLHKKPYLSTRLALINNDVDFVVLRQNEVLDGCYPIPITIEESVDATIPVIMINRNDYYMDRILCSKLNLSEIANIQNEVLASRRPPEFY